jgi:hypothetical protein
LNKDSVVFETYRAATGKVLDKEDAQKVSTAVLSFRYVFDEFLSNPAIVLRTLFASAPTKKLIFPCDPVELRSILEDDHLTIRKGILPLFAWFFSNRYFRKYSVFLIIDSGKLDVDCKDLGGVVIYDVPKLCVENAILRVVVNRSASDDVVRTVQGILRSTGRQIELVVQNAVPGTSPAMPGLSVNVTNPMNVTKVDSMKERKLTSMSWFKQVKIADASSGAAGSDDFNPYEGTPLANMDDEIVLMKRYKTKPAKEGPAIEHKPNGETHKNDVVQISYRVGDEVRDRRKGMAVRQRFGKITDLKDDSDGNKVYVVKWEDKEDPEKFRLNDAVSLAAILARI